VPRVEFLLRLTSIVVRLMYTRTDLFFRFLGYLVVEEEEETRQAQAYAVPRTRDDGERAAGLPLGSLERDCERLLVARWRRNPWRIFETRESSTRMPFGLS
jgi:hypothetical protein